MSLMGTLAKVAIGVAVAKGVGGLIKSAGGSATGGSTGTGGTFGGQYSPGGGLEDMMGEILSGRKAPGRPASGNGSVLGGSGGGLGDLLEDLTGGARPGPGTGGGLDDILGGLTGAKGGGGLGDLLGGLIGGLAGGAAGGRGGSFGDLLNQSLGNRGEPDTTPTREQDAAAGLMLKAMIQAAKSDGKIDAEEQRKLTGNLGDISAGEQRFVEAELRAPVDVQGLARQVPKGLEAQVYTMSVMAIDLDNRSEAQYLHSLATALGLDQGRVNGIHARLGVPKLYG